MGHGYKGRFIVLEGIELNGKDTHTTALAKYLFYKNKEHSVILTREPTKLTEEGKILRKMLLEMENPRKDSEKFFNLLVDDRTRHVNELIVPALKFGATVISNRHKYSTIAYEGSLGIPIPRIIEAHKGMVVPDLTIILDITMEEFEKRFAENSDTHKEVFDKDKAFISQVREVYLQMPELLPEENIKIISSMEPFEEVHQKVIEEVEKILY